MTLHALSRLPLSADDGWRDLIRMRPSLLAIFALVVLPLSLVPPRRKEMRETMIGRIRERLRQSAEKS